MTDTTSAPPANPHTSVPVATQHPSGPPPPPGSHPLPSAQRKSLSLPPPPPSSTNGHHASVATTHHAHTDSEVVGLVSNAPNQTADRRFDIRFYEAPYKEPKQCCLACWCWPCVQYETRTTVLDGDINRYYCCQGFIPAACYKPNTCREQSNPRACLTLESTFCPCLAVQGTRKHLMTTKHYKRDNYDTCGDICGNIVQLCCGVCAPCIGCCMTACFTAQIRHDLNLHADQSIPPPQQVMTQ